MLHFRIEFKGKGQKKANDAIRASLALPKRQTAGINYESPSFGLS